MHVLSFTTLCKVLILTTLLISQSKAETATSGNLLPNAGDGRSNPQNQTSTLDNTNVNSGFTLDSGITAWANELEAEGTGTVSATGSLENITTTTQSGNSHTTTTTSLDGGVTLNSSTEVQNCEHSSSAYRCGRDYPGVDSYSTTLKILDENNNVLASTSITRNNDAGYNNSTYTYTDTVTHNNTGARKWDWQWQGIDSQSPTSGGALGPNLLGASLTATLLDITYQPITEEQQEDINEAVEEIEDAIEEIKFEEIENIKIEEIKIEEIKIEEIKIEELKVEFEETFKEILIEENLMETFETALIEEEITEEEFFEEVGNIMEEELLPMPSMKEEEIAMTEPKMEEFKEEEIEEMKEEEIANEEEIATEESPQEEVKEETPTETNTETESNANTETTTEAENTSEESMENEQEGEPSSEESTMDENTEAEGSETETNNEEAVDDEATGDDRQENDEIDSVNVKVKRIIAKLEKTLKDVNDTVKAVQFVTLKGIQSGAADLSSYNVQLQDTVKLFDGNPDFFNQLNIEQEQIYKDVSLNAYTNNDPISIKQTELQRIDMEKKQLLLELKILREG